MAVRNFVVHIRIAPWLKYYIAGVTATLWLCRRFNPEAEVNLEKVNRMVIKGIKVYRGT